jgi:predicted homoserine dehydrogenase-like protein
LPTPVADIISVAKRDLKAGEVLDGSGGYTVNGLIERAEIARTENLLPLGLASGVKLKTDVIQGTAITYDMVELDEDSFVLKLRRLQDATVWSESKLG